ncbi:MAG: DUF192 domain-containing protein [Bdellovibrionales bacterium]
MRRPLVIIGVCALVWLGLALALREPVDPAFPEKNLAIRKANGETIFLDIRIAATPEEQAKGLMFRTGLPRDAGMLFIFDPPQIMSMWMKNTEIALDMLFVRADGAIAKIVTHAVPHSLQPHSSGEPVKGVLELNGGEADRRGIHVGDHVVYPGFGAP